MALEKLEKIIGVIDGANTAFEAPDEYRPNTVHLWYNGDHQQFNLTEGLGKSVTITPAPREGSIIFLRYIVR